MATNSKSMFTWLKQFKNVWLPETFSSDNTLLRSINRKLLELEKIIVDRGELDDDQEEEYYRNKLLYDHSCSESDTDGPNRRPLPTSTPLDRSLPTPPDNIHQSFEEENDEEQAKQRLLDQTDSDQSNEDLRPTIRVKRLTYDEVNEYIPSKPTSRRPSHRQETATSSSSSSSTSNDDEDYCIRTRTKTRSRVRSNRSKSPSSSSSSSSPSKKQSTSKQHNREVVISYAPASPPVIEPSPMNSLTLDNDVTSEQMIQNLIDNRDNESVFASLDIIPDRQVETDNSPPIELAPNQEEEEEQNETEDPTPVEVPSYAHLLAENRSSPSDKGSKKRSIRSSSSSSNSDVLSTKKKKSKSIIKQRMILSSLSSDEDSDETLTSKRAQIELSSDESSPKIAKKKKSSKNAKLVNSSDSNSDNDEETSPSQPSGHSQGRKNIRKIIDDKELDNQTKDAIEAERERRKRIAEKQKEYNDTLLDQSLEVVTDEQTSSQTTVNRLILEFDKTTNEAIIEVSPKLVAQLKPHQCEGVRFLWNNLFESLEAIEKKKQTSNGCILAHCMGLGKTLQVISLIHTVLNYQEITKTRTCLVLCPINAALNWTNEFDYWLKDIEPMIDHYQLTTVKSNLRVNHLNYWYEHGGVMIMGYELYRRLASGFGIKNKKLKTEAYQSLVDPGPDIIIADEGHILKNAQTALAKSLAKIRTSRRVVLTGTPLQNNLIEYYCMVSFIKPNLLGTQQEYINRFVNPIQNGQHRDSNEDDVRLMKRRACVLHELLTGFVDRKDYSLLKEYLPPKFEYIINIRLSDLQSMLYETYLKKQVNQEQRLSVSKKDFKSAKLFADYNYLQKIWTHPFLLYPHFIDRWKKQFDKDEENSIDDNEIETIFGEIEEDLESKKKTKKKEKKTNSFSGFLIDNIDREVDEKKPMIDPSEIMATVDSGTENDENPTSVESISKSTDEDDDDIEVIRTYPTRSRTVANEPEKSPAPNSDEPWLDEMREQFWFSTLDALPEESRFDVELSGKFLLLKSIIDKCHDIGDKLLLFSRSLYTLNHIEKLLHHLHQQNEQDYQKQCQSRRQLKAILEANGNDDQVSDSYVPEPVHWIRDQDYFRMDGQTDVTARKRYAKAFNDTSNFRARLFLISTLAGGIGINLTGSNRVIVFDASWNPSHDTQAIFRSYRFGQKKPVYIYRFLAHGTMEEKIYQRQVVKQSISQRVVDDHQLDRHFTQNDIKELYKFQAEKLPDAQPIASLLNEADGTFQYPIPKDHLLLDLLYEHHRWIHSYHSHDSLLENRIDEGLTADERRRALEEYENLKRLPDPRQLAYQRLQQQQQLNAMIAQQQKLVAAAAAVQRANGGGQTMPNTLTPTVTYLQLIQSLYNTSMTARRPPPIHIRPMPNSTDQGRTANRANASDVICIESDEERMETGS